MRLVTILVLAVTAVSACKNGGANSSPAADAASPGAAGDGGTVVPPPDEALDAMLEAMSEPDGAMDAVEVMDAMAATVDATSDTTDIGTTDAGAPDTGSGTPGLTYKATPVAGGYDRLFISIVDTVRGKCLKLILRSPGPSPLSSPPAITVPAPWGFELASLFADTQACANNAIRTGGVAAATGTGEISWVRPPLLAVPCTLDIHAQLTFPATSAQPTVTYQLDQTQVPVGTCP